MRSRLAWLVLLFIVAGSIFMWTSWQNDSQKNLRLILNSENIEGQLPRNFRMSVDPWLGASSKKEPSRLGLDQLNASGSGQFSEDGLKAILSRLNNSQPITVVDLRQESHGFVNGIAVSWYAPRDASNVGKSLAEIEADESKRLQGLLSQKEVSIEDVFRKAEDVIAKSTPMVISVEGVATEKELTGSLNVSYFRIPVTDHLPPTKEDVERFLSFVRSVPANTWLHFHCEAGDGRTTSFLSMYDMFRNAKNVSFEDIIERQYRLGGIDLAEMPEKSSWKYSHEVDRLKFLQEFYLRMKNGL